MKNLMTWCSKRNLYKIFLFSISAFLAMVAISLAVFDLSQFPEHGLSNIYTEDTIPNLLTYVVVVGAGGIVSYLAAKKLEEQQEADTHEHKVPKRPQRDNRD